ncbi:MAG: tetratricopeptide repeat protein [Parafilimonas sp.]|nr:tetratricopeptide repeat protein [Parafilimonas sp.]
MKKKNIYLLSIILFCVAVTGIFLKYNYKKAADEKKDYVLLERKGVLANSMEWKQAKHTSDSLLALIKDNPTDSKSQLRLASLYIQEARVTGNYAYYDVAAMKYINDVLNLDSLDFNALVFKSLIYMSQHHFADGLVIAHKAQQVNPYNGYVYGLLVDGNVEMGNYDSAVVYADKMAAVRPDLTSYSRVSYVREILGDYSGAIKAMQMAVEAGGPGDEHTEWARYQLANLYQKIGDYKMADTLYQISLSMRPNYAYALAGLAQIAMANKDYKKAISLYIKADSVVDDYSIKEELVDAYQQSGQQQKADQLSKQVIDELNANSQAAVTNQNLGHYADRELAYAYLKIKDNDKALDHALMEYNRRPNNIDVNETVAWVYYCKGDYAKAVPYINVALRTHSKNPVLLSRAALIYYKSGNEQLAKTTIAETSLQNPYIEPELKMEAEKTVAKL